MQDDFRGATAAISLRELPFWTLSVVLMILAAVVAPIGFVFGQMEAGSRPSLQQLLILVATTLIAISVVVIVRWRTRPRSKPAIVLERDYVRLPVTSHSLRTRDVPYADVLSLDVFGKGKLARILVNTRRKLFVYQLSSFDHPDPVTPLRAAIRTALTALADDSLIQAMDERERLGKQASVRNPLVTMALLAIIGVVFLIEMLLGTLDRTFALVQYGANAPTLVWNGQWFRLFSANFLHLNAIHLYMNAAALFSLGLLLEKLTGGWRFICIYLLSAVGGALTSALFAQAAFSVGASTAIYGLFGSLAVLNWKYRVQLPSGFRQSATWWVVIVTLNVVLAALLPAIDIGAHAGGALVGAATTLMLYRGVDAIRIEPQSGRALSVFVSVVIAVFGIALIIAGLHSRRENPEQDSLTVARDFVNSTATKPGALNTYAWNVYLDEQASDTELDLALQAVRKAIARADDVEFLDSQAALLFRTGQVDEAVRSELRALAMHEKNFYWWQLTRFLARRVEERGPLLPEAATEPPQLSIVESEAPLALELRGTHGCVADCTIYMLVRQAQSVVGVLQVLVGAEAQAEFRLNADFIAGWQAFPRHASLELALVEVGTCGACQRRDIRGRYVPLDEKLH